MNVALLRQHFQRATGITVSMKTVRDRLDHVGLYNRRPIACVTNLYQWTNVLHIESGYRRGWDEWSNVLFTDDYCFSVKLTIHELSSGENLACGIILHSCIKWSIWWRGMMICTGFYINGPQRPVHYQELSTNGSAIFVRRSSNLLWSFTLQQSNNSHLMPRTESSHNIISLLGNMRYLWMIWKYL